MTTSPETQPVLTATERLVAALTAEKDARINHIRVLAATGWYDELRSDHPNPQGQLVLDLTLAGRPDLAARAARGEWQPSMQELLDWSDANPAVLEAER